MGRERADVTGRSGDRGYRYPFPRVVGPYKPLTLPRSPSSVSSNRAGSLACCSRTFAASPHNCKKSVPPNGTGYWLSAGFTDRSVEMTGFHLTWCGKNKLDRFIQMEKYRGLVGKNCSAEATLEKPVTAFSSFASQQSGNGELLVGKVGPPLDLYCSVTAVSQKPRVIGRTTVAKPLFLRSLDESIIDKLCCAQAYLESSGDRLPKSNMAASIGRSDKYCMAS